MTPQLHMSVAEVAKLLAVISGAMKCNCRVKVASTESARAASREIGLTSKSRPQLATRTVHEGP